MHIFIYFFLGHWLAGKWILCLTPSNVLLFCVTAEIGTVECPGFAKLSTFFGIFTQIYQPKRLFWPKNQDRSAWLKFRETMCWACFKNSRKILDMFLPSNMLFSTNSIYLHLLRFYKKWCYFLKFPNLVVMALQFYEKVYITYTLQLLRIFWSSLKVR